MVSCPPGKISSPVTSSSPSIAGSCCPFILQEHRSLHSSARLVSPQLNSFLTCLCRLSRSLGILPHICTRRCHLDWEDSCKDKGQMLFVLKTEHPPPSSPASQLLLQEALRGPAYAQESLFIAWACHRQLKRQSFVRQTRVCICGQRPRGKERVATNRQSHLCVRGVLHTLLHVTYTISNSPGK